jgi:hypothetical protein
LKECTEQLRDDFGLLARLILGCEFHERNHDKLALAHPRMGNLQSGLLDSSVSEHQNIQVQRPRAIPDCCRSVPPEFLFDAQQPGEQGMRFELRLQRNHCV